MAITADIITGYAPFKGAYLRIDHAAWRKSDCIAATRLPPTPQKEAAAAGLASVRHWSFQFRHPTPASQADCYADVKSRIRSSATPKDQFNAVTHLSLDAAVDV